MRVRSLDVLARQILDRGGPWTVHSAFARACNLLGPGGELLGITGTAGGHAPATLVLDGSRLTEPFSTLVSPGQPAALTGGALLIGRRLRLELAGAWLWSPAPIVRMVSDPDIQRRLKMAAEIGAASAPAGGLTPLLPVALALAEGSAESLDTGASQDLMIQRARQLLADLMAAIREWRWADTCAPAQALSGLGPGLTPAGDDLLAGLALGLRAALGTLPAELQAAFTEAVVGRTTDLAAARVRHAAAGHPDERVHRLLTELVVSQSSDGLPAAVRAVLEYGHSSGVDTLVGLFAGARLGIG